MAKVEVQIATAHNGIPQQALFEKWVDTTLKKTEQAMEKELSIRIIDREESRELNLQYRGKDAPTNVLSFPCDLPAEVDIPLLGDLAICAEVVADEAEQQTKALESHWAHMVVHGTMHLLGYDHVDDDEAETMEHIETQILAVLGYPPPY